MTTLAPKRSCSSATETQNPDLFNYTSGRWVYNEPLRLKERQTIFDVDALCRLAAKSVNRPTNSIASFTKLAEGGFNRTFLVVFQGGFKMVARIPYPITAPKYFAIASEVATMEFLGSFGMPVPEVYGYSPSEDNDAETAYIFMEYVQGSSLIDVWRGLKDEEVVDVIRQITQLEVRMMRMSFPAGGSLYFGEDLEKVGMNGVPVSGDERFCVGPDTRVPLWYGRRAQLEVDRGPYHSVEDALVAGAYKEIAYLKRFGKPLLPFRRERRPSFKFQPQSPSEHIQNLERYLSIAPSLIPEDARLTQFRIRHPDLQFANIIINSACQVVGLIDWQHTSVLPMFLLAGIPQRLQNHDDASFRQMIHPLRPENLDGMSDARRDHEEYIFRRRLVHHHYVKNSRECNGVHYAAFMDPLYAIRGKLFEQAGALWEGETLELKVALIEAWKRWDELVEARGGTSATASRRCPIEFDDEELRETKIVREEIEKASLGFEWFQNMAGVVGENGWVLSEDYDLAKAFLMDAKEGAMKGALSEAERQEIMEEWPWDDMDEEGYM
ncbi:kinase-like domain-containing protein [Coprinopsis sp. MPI-PUGE-AT-0042]|nr:kinase-like domain-containing protein [Coprinopsis sp. MPI-PUGE-AT-0042]